MGMAIGGVEAVIPDYGESKTVTNSSSTTFNRAHHRFAVFVALCTFLLILAGATVTSNDAGLSVPDWPTSFGSLYRIPPMVDGVQFEHGHRMIAQFIGLLTIVLAVWTQRVDRRPWMRALGWAALATVIAQGILGGITVLFYLPPAVSTAHATLGQTFFCIVVSMALFTGRGWVKEAPVLITQSERPRLTTLSVLAVCSVYLQLILGAAFRHSGMKLLPHLVSAVVVTAVLLWTCVRVLSRLCADATTSQARGRRCWCCCLCSSRSVSGRILRALNGARRAAAGDEHGAHDRGSRCGRRADACDFRHSRDSGPQAHRGGGDTFDQE